MMWIYILQNDRSNINNQLSWSLKVWYATSIRRKETLHATTPPQCESSVIDFPPAIFSYHSSKNSQHQESSQLQYQPLIAAREWSFVHNLQSPSNNILRASNRNSIFAVFTRDIRIRLQVGKCPCTWESDIWTPWASPIFHCYNPLDLYERMHSQRKF